MEDDKKGVVQTFRRTWDKEEYEKKAKEKELNGEKKEKKKSKSKFLKKEKLTIFYH